LISLNRKGSLVDPAALVTPTALSIKSSFQRQTEAESRRRGKEREGIHRITNELQDSIKYLLDALLRSGRAKQGVIRERERKREREREEKSVAELARSN